MHLTIQQVSKLRDILQDWHELEEAYLLGRRLTESDDADSSVDLAVRLGLMDEVALLALQEEGEIWRGRLSAAIGRTVWLLPLCGSLTPAHEAAVQDHGIQIIIS